MQVKYVGPHAAVDVQVAPGTWRRVQRGAALDTTPEHAESLLLQEDNWQMAEAPAARSSADTADSRDGE